MDSRLFESLQWRQAGPHRGGRVVAVAGHPTQPATFYFGACAGGVWQSTDAGSYWENISDGYFTTAAIGALAVSEADPNVLYAGTGETAIRSNVSHGDGVYKSTDGGKSWTNVGLQDTRHIARIRIHPEDPEVVYVAALGHAWGPNPERGVYRSTDGGATWEQVLYQSEKAGAIDLSMDPGNPRVLYAAMWEAQRYPHKAVSGGEDSGIWKTSDGGETWEDITRKPGLPAGVLGKIGIAVSPAKPDRVYAIVEAKDGALFRSDDGGQTWQRMSEDPDLRRRAWYYMHIYADPTDPDTVWVLNMKQKKSINGGKDFFEVPSPHGDNHDLWIDPNNPERMVQGNDGGACVSLNGGITWSTLHNQPTAQFYHVTADNQTPYRIYGSQQDNSAITIPSMSLNGAITEQEWIEPGGGESGYIAIQPQEPHLVFAGGIGSGLGHGRLLAWDPRTGHERNVTVWPELHGMGAGVEEHKYRFQWTFPIEISPHNPQAVYIAGNHLFRSMDNGTSWEMLSPDLTRNDPKKQRASGGPITRDNTGAEAYCTIFAFRESPHEPGIFWVGTDDGLMHISRDGGESWRDITPPIDLLPGWALISIIEPSPFEPGTAYVAATRYKHDDVRPYLLKTTNYGQTWALITQGIPQDDFTRVIRADPNRQGLLYAGTETGLYISFDDGASWQQFQLNLPVCPIHDLIIKDRDLVVATHGRSFWILDDLTPLHQMSGEIENKEAHLFKPGSARRIRVYSGFGNEPTTDFVNFEMSGTATVSYAHEEKPDGTKKDRLLDAGENPPNGVIIHYYLREKPKDGVKLSILDEDGNEISSETDAPAEAGANRRVWHMLLDGPTKLEEESGGDIFSDLMADALRPKALPGIYQVQLEAGGRTLTESFEILEDPRKPAPLADLNAQFKLKKQIRDTLSEVHEMLNHLRRLRGQVEDWEQRMNRHGEIRELADAALVVKTKLSSIEGELVQLKASSPLGFDNRLKEKLASLAFMIDEADAAPTFGSYELYEELATRVMMQQDILKRVINEDLRDFNQKIESARIPSIVP